MYISDPTSLNFKWHNNVYNTHFVFHRYSLHLSCLCNRLTLCWTQWSYMCIVNLCVSPDINSRKCHHTLYISLVSLCLYSQLFCSIAIWKLSLQWCQKWKWQILINGLLNFALHYLWCKLMPGKNTIKRVSTCVLLYKQHFLQTISWLCDEYHFDA